MTDRAPFHDPPPVPNDLDDLKSWLTRDSGWTQPTVYSCADFWLNLGCDDFHLYAVISSWFESDVIQAAVQNCFRHGCNRVYLLDNDSPDTTVATARAAGAELLESYHTDYYQEELRVKLLNQHLQRIVSTERYPVLWVVCLDADEFLHAPRGLRFRDYLAHLDPTCNTVPMQSIDHYPSPGSTRHNERGLHPAEFQPLVWLRRTPTFCQHGHWKHPCYRYRNGVVDGCFMRGCHTPLLKRGRCLVEPTEHLWLHHIPFRNEDFTRARLQALCGAQDRLGGQRRSAPDDQRLAGEGAIKRFRCLDDIYAGRWDRIELPHAQGSEQKVGVPVRPWIDLLPHADYQFLRWYGTDDIRLTNP